MVGRGIDDIRLPKGAGIGAVVRGDKVMMPHHGLAIESDDHVVLFVNDKQCIPSIESLFQVKAAYI